MSALPTWKRKHGKTLTLAEIKEIVGHRNYSHPTFSKSVHFILKLRFPEVETQTYQNIDYLVKPWDISSNTLKSMLFKRYFRKHGVTEWKHLVDKTSAAVDDDDDSDIEHDEQEDEDDEDDDDDIDEDRDESSIADSQPSNKRTNKFESPPAKRQRTEHRVQFKQETEEEEAKQEEEKKEKERGKRVSNTLSPDTPEPGSTEPVLMSMSNTWQPHCNLNLNLNNLPNIDVHGNGNGDPSIPAAVPLMANHNVCNYNNNNNNSNNNLAMVSNRNLFTLSSSLYHQENMDLLGPSEVIQKLQMVHHILLQNMNGMNLEQLLKNTQFLNYLMSRCDRFQFELSNTLEKENKICFEMNAEFDSLSKIVANYQQEMVKYEQQIRHLTVIFNQYKHKVNQLNDKLIKNVKCNKKLKENIIQNKRSLDQMQNETQRTERVCKDLLHRIECMEISKWTETNIIDWILSICHGYFSQAQYRPFVENVRNSRINHQTFQTQINELLLQAWGLSENTDISMFMVSYQRLMRTQSNRNAAQ